MPWRGPRYKGDVPTLGWVALDWIRDNLIVPDGPMAGRPLRLTREQARFVLSYYAIGKDYWNRDFRAVDTSGTFVNARSVRRAILSRPKGWGKSPLLAAFCLLEGLAPVVPDGWDDAGKPVGISWADLGFMPKVQIVAVSEDQTANTWEPLLEMARNGPVADRYAINAMETFVDIPRGIIEYVTSSARSREGFRPVFSACDQALELGTMIPTPNGWTTMGDLKVGDTVFGSDGRPATVVQAKPVSIDHDCYRVTFADGTSVVASDGHLWFAKLSGSAAVPKIRTTGEMFRDATEGSHARRARRREMIGEALKAEPQRSNFDIAAEVGANRKTVAAIRARLERAGTIPHVRRSTGNAAPQHRPTVEVVGDDTARRFMIPVAPAQHLPEADLSVPPYLLGYWLGDGTRRKCELSVNGDDLADIQANLARIGVETWARRYGASPGGYAPGGDQVNLTFSRCWGYQGGNRPEPAKALAALPCYVDRHVPIEYLRGSIEQRTELLRGMMDSDGSCTPGGHCTFVSTSRSLADGVTELLRSLGQVTSGPQWVQDDRYGNGGKYRVGFTPRSGLNPFALPRKADRVRGHQGGTEWVSILSIEPVERVPVRCIEVDSEDHLFAFGEAGHLTHNTESWVPSIGGPKLAAAIRRNLTKTGGSSIETPNAFIPGEDSVAEMSYKAWQMQEDGKLKAEAGILFDHREAPSTVDMDDPVSLREGLKFAYGDSSWVDIERVMADIYDPSSEVSDSRRFFLNQITAASDAWLSRPELAAIARADIVVADKTMIALGFDGSRGKQQGTRGNPDATALVAVTLDGGHIFPIGVWEAPPDLGVGEWKPPVDEVNAKVAETFAKFNVVAFYADPAKWEGHIAQWEASHGKKLRAKASRDHPVEWWVTNVGNTSRIVRAVKSLRDAIEDGECTFDGSSVLTRHFLNARMRPTRSGVTISKRFPDSPDKIDAAFAAVIAWQARTDAILAGVMTRRTPAFVPRRIL